VTTRGAHRDGSRAERYRRDDDQRWAYLGTRTGLATHSRRHAIAPAILDYHGCSGELVSKCELRIKRAREEVAKGYYDVSLISIFLGRNL